jgi:8-oxo-dGTP pyrophosphatase MutT (NUDIX family)
MKFNNIPNEKIILPDGRIFWKSRSVAIVITVSTLINGEFYYAIGKRSSKADLDSPGLWCLPCGYLDFNENITQAAIRECYEEMGIDISSVVSNHPWRINSDPSENRQNVVFHFDAVFKELKPLQPNPDEVDDAKWVTIQQLKDFQFAFKHDQIILYNDMKNKREIYG